MTNHYLRNTTSDYITGAVSACEGIRDSLVLLNGPLGCRFYHGYASGQGIVKASELWHLRGELRVSDAMDDQLLRSQYFAGTPQVPGTNLYYEDNIFGTREQLNRALNDIFAERKYSFFSVIQTPGTSLLGEALEEDIQSVSREFDVPCLYIETPCFSSTSFAGYDESTVKLLALLAQRGQERTPHERPCVNLFGFYTYEKYLEGDVGEITRLLSLCGIDVNCAVGANCTIESFRRIPQADLNIILSPERCHKTEAYLREQFQTPVFNFGYMPIGFDLMESFVREVSTLLNTTCAPAVEDIQRARARAFYYIARHTGGRGFSKDMRYAVEGECSLLCAYVDFLSGYLGIFPAAVHLLYSPCPGEDREKLEAGLRALHAEQALTRDITKVRDAVVLGSANTIMEITALNQNIFGIEIAGPSSGYVHVVPKTHLGSTGGLFLLEQIINGARLLNAWK